MLTTAGALCGVRSSALRASVRSRRVGGYIQYGVAAGCVSVRQSRAWEKSRAIAEDLPDGSKCC